MYGVGMSVSSGQAEDALRNLDKEIKLFESYKERRVSRIDSLKKDRSRMAVGSRPWLEQTMAIAKSYNAFNNDSALFYYSQGIEWSAKENLDYLKTEFRLRRYSSNASYFSSNCPI